MSNHVDDQSYLDVPEPAEPQLIPRFHSYAQAGRIFGRTPRTIRWWVKTGRLRAIKIGGARLISDTEIQRFSDGGEG